MKRNYGIDAARIVAIWSVICWHIVVEGGICPNMPKSDLPIALLFLDFLTVGCVDIFGLISGYVGLNGRHRISSLVKLWLQVFVTNGAIAAAMVLLADVSLDMRDVLFPVLRRAYWYFTAYVPLFFLMPVLDNGVRSMSREKCRKFCAMLIILLAITRIFARQDPFKFSEGFSFAWLLVLYIIGALLNRSSFTPKPVFCFLSFLLLVALGVIATLCLGRVAILQSVFRGYIPCYGYTSPTVLCGAIFLILGLSSCSAYFERHKRVIGFFSVSAFGVYLIHVQPIFWKRSFVGKFHFLNNYGEGGQFFTIIGLAILIYLVCSCLEWMRILLFRYLRVQERVQVLDCIVERELGGDVT